MVVLRPAGDIAAQQRDLVLLATGLMLLIIVPVIALTLLFAWKYRASNLQATYAPDWSHSNRIEMAVWGAPLAIILVLGAVTWTTSHTLDPYRPLSRLAPHRPIPAGVKPLEVDVVALDWKWLFIYPEQGVASVNELAAPVDRPIAFKITASSVMNAFYVPALAGQIYAMPGMQTQLNAVINQPGVYEGFSSNYSGAGFSGMKFKFKGLTPAEFDHWVAQAKAASPALTRADYLALARPSTDEPVRRFASVDPTLFLAVVNRCAAPGQVCKDQMKSPMPSSPMAVAMANRIRCAPTRRAPAQHAS
ncbi:ubiquinol oxidase subunit II [Phenylobacterium montanum]|uniref:Ubiquinol oxidase subunit 2 n=2 Tax=Phenylobacterium montanum TaxID=2823693 RepID=A0A975IX84_9CAUL|nr:ubiquinol oxidase subunit II [Caulobacter sp. S6]